MLCPECRTALSGAAPSRVRPDPEPPGLPVVHAAARYADEVRAVVLAHKERGALALAAPLGVALAGAVRAGLGAGPGPGSVGGGLPVLLVPVPSAPRAVRARGHDPARRIALAAAAELRRAGTPARVLAVLRQRRAVADQSGLNSRQRSDNLAGALAVALGGERLLGGGPVVLVDDLMTTGASLTEAARAVREGVGRGGWEGAGRGPGSAATARLGTAEGSPPPHPGPVAHDRPAGPPPAHSIGPTLGPTIGPRDCATAVCPAGSREEREERCSEVTPETVRRHGVPGMAGGVRAGEVMCAAVVAASPDAFEINRN